MWQSKYQLIEFEARGAVLIVRFARGEGLNAINARMHTEMSWLFRDIAEHSDCSAVVLTGKGKAFSAGGDIDWFSNISPAEVDQLFVEARRLIVDMLELPQPIISAINGPAVGLGATLALFCDISYMGKSAVIADTHVLAGIAAGDGGAAIWPWLIGMHRAKEFLLTGRKITAGDAERLGLVNHVVDDDALLEAALGMAQELAGGSQMAIRATKTSLNKILRDTVNLNLDTSLALEKACFYSADHKDRLTAFLTKRHARQSSHS
ncbi:enoyl-CoA hydratase/isomerase family protein [Castellaniella hirudinis]|uniref:Enoyl-CoA hydratase/isomerase family protein n=1 Tax=Castellaniella hirudinis TaxID=1144617 RepID=A0ABV8RU19_9BURK